MEQRSDLYSGQYVASKPLDAAGNAIPEPFFCKLLFVEECDNTDSGWPGKVGRIEGWVLLSILLFSTGFVRWNVECLYIYTVENDQNETSSITYFYDSWIMNGASHQSFLPPLS